MDSFTKTDFKFMYQALKLAGQVKGSTFPNPAVGAVVVKKGKIIGRGATAHYGGDHAEKTAIYQAGKNTCGATLYVTLEPCCHFGKTPPCTNTIINAGIMKVIVAVKDPNPLVNGCGIRLLRKNNISVLTGCLKKEAEKLNEDFFWTITRAKPWIAVKLALTLDGKIADTINESKWITNEKARRYVHEIRRRHAAIGVGRQTLIRDNPQLTVRHAGGNRPARIVFTSTPVRKAHLNFFQNTSKIRSIIVCNNGKAGIIKKKSNNVEIWYTGKRKTPDNLLVFMKMALKNGLTSILIEGGQKIASSFLEYQLVNRLYLFYGNKIIGSGKDGLLFSKGLSVNKCFSLRDITTCSFDDTFMVCGIPVRSS